ncbi:MAG: hypothetical protein M0Q92_05120 [Methanoregula sp.]|jgi:hypothetical protein|nr:hypothetical protein [Methanoregula sp.]
MMEVFPPLARMLQLILAGICLFLLVFGAIIVLFSNAIFNEPRVILDESAASALPVNVSRSFSFHNTSASVTISIYSSVYEASKKTYRSIILVGDPKGLGTRYYQVMINDPTQDRIYEDLLEQFRKIRAERNLTDDEYLEMMTAYIQTIPYKDGGNSPPKYPAELLVENMGDCDDKAILLSGLLAREGYSVVLLKFGPESHMAMGIGSDAFPYKSTGYTYLEAMTPAYIGIPSFSIMTRKPLKSDPLVIPVSTGTKIYHGGSQTRYISNMSVLTEQKAAELTLRLDAFPVTERNGTEYLAVLGERDRSAAIHTYIRNHPLDRPGVMAYLKKEVPA